MHMQRLTVTSILLLATCMQVLAQLPGFFAEAPMTLRPPPPGPPGMCGEVGELCCEGEQCMPGAACNAHEVYTENADYYPDAFTCMECGGMLVYEDYDLDFRRGQLACTDGAPCEAGLEVYDCDGSPFPAQCYPCGQKDESCCNVGVACEGDMQCLDYDTCGTCGALREPACPGDGSEGPKCDEGLVARAAPPATNVFIAGGVRCLPPLPCGSDPGAECCVDADACFGTDGFGTPLTCVEGVCERCGLRGTPPCDDGCVDELMEVRGVCRRAEDALCGMQGEVCCGADYDVPDYGDQCGEGLVCDYDYGDYAFAPSPAAGLGFGVRPPFGSPEGTCEPCGGSGMPPCNDGPFAPPINGCDEGLEVDYSDYDFVCKPSCGIEGGTPCMPSENSFDVFVCPCKSGLLPTDGTCEVAPVRPAPTPSTTGSAPGPSAPMRTPAAGPVGLESSSTATSHRERRARGGRARRPRNPRGERMDRMRGARRPRGSRK